LKKFFEKIEKIFQEIQENSRKSRKLAKIQENIFSKIGSDLGKVRDSEL
jgi:hypothetical protein